MSERLNWRISQNDPNIQIVENFLKSKKLDAKTRETLGAVKGNGPAFAIDPNSLTPAERAQYENNPKLVERKVFAKKGGMNAADVAEMLGARDVADLMKALSEASTLNEAVDARVKARSAEIRNRIESSTPYNETAIAKSLDNKSNALAQALEYYKNGDGLVLKKPSKLLYFQHQRSQTFAHKPRRLQDRLASPILTQHNLPRVNFVPNVKPPTLF